jgi:hypothetical protein
MEIKVYNFSINNINKQYVLYIHGACHGSWCFDKIGTIISNNYLGYSLDFKNVTIANFNNYVSYLNDVINYLFTKHKKYPILICHSMGTIIVQHYITNSIKSEFIPGVVFLTPMNPTIKGVFNTMLHMGLKYNLFFIFMSFGLFKLEYLKDINFLKKMFFNDKTDIDSVKECSEKITLERMSLISLNWYPSIIIQKYKFPMLFVSSVKDMLISNDIVYDLYTKYKNNENDVQYLEFKESGHDIMLDKEFIKLSNIIIDFIRYKIEKKCNHKNE